MEIKNLSQLKKAIKAKHEFRIIEHHIHPDKAGQIRVVNIMQTNGMYTYCTNDADAEENSVNNGKGIWCDFGKASDWVFNGQ